MVLNNTLGPLLYSILNCAIENHAEMEQWLAEHEYESINQLKGSVSQQHAIDPSAYERANYVQVLDGYSSPAGGR